MFAATLWIPLLVAFLGYLLTYSNNVRLEDRKMRLKYLSDQLQVLYGPLFSLSHASHQAWGELTKTLRPESKVLFDDADPLTEAELKRWRLWMTTVFQPLNLRMEEAIINNAHLIVGSDMPVHFQEFLAHVEAYRAVIQQWQVGDYSRHTASLPYPKSLDEYLKQTFLDLSRHQSKLLRL